MDEMRRFATLAGVAVLAGLLPPGNTAAQTARTKRQQAGYVLGYALGVSSSKKCPALERMVGGLIVELSETYDFTIEDYDEDSSIGKQFVHAGRAAAARDAEKPDFCSSAEREMAQARANLL